VIHLRTCCQIAVAASCRESLTRSGRIRSVKCGRAEFLKLDPSLRFLWLGHSCPRSCPCDEHERPSHIRSFHHRTQNWTHLLHVLKGKRSHASQESGLSVVYAGRSPVVQSPALPGFEFPSQNETQPEARQQRHVRTFPGVRNDIIFEVHEWLNFRGAFRRLLKATSLSGEIVQSNSPFKR